MAGKFLNALSGFSSDVLDGIRAKNNERLDDAAFEERVVGLKMPQQPCLKLMWQRVK